MYPVTLNSYCLQQEYLIIPISVPLDFTQMCNEAAESPHCTALHLSALCTPVQLLCVVMHSMEKVHGTEPKMVWAKRLQLNLCMLARHLARHPTTFSRK